LEDQEASAVKIAHGVTNRTQSAMVKAFFADQLSDGRPFRILNLIDDFLDKSLTSL